MKPLRHYCSSKVFSLQQHCTVLYMYVRLLSLTFQLFKRNPKTKQLVCTNLFVNRSVQKLQFNTVRYLFLVERYCVLKLSIFFALDSFIFILDNLFVYLLLDIDTAVGFINVNHCLSIKLT